MYVSDLKKNLIFISNLEEKGMRVAFLNGKVLYWPKESQMRNVFALGSRVE